MKKHLGIDDWIIRYIAFPMMGWQASMAVSFIIGRIFMRNPTDNKLGDGALHMVLLISFVTLFAILIGSILYRVYELRVVKREEAEFQDFYNAAKKANLPLKPIFDAEGGCLNLMEAMDAQDHNS